MLCQQARVYFLACKGYQKQLHRMLQIYGLLRCHFAQSHNSASSLESCLALAKDCLDLAHCAPNRAFVLCGTTPRTRHSARCPSVALLTLGIQPGSGIICFLGNPKDNIFIVSWSWWSQVPSDERGNPSLLHKGYIGTHSLPWALAPALGYRPAHLWELSELLVCLSTSQPSPPSHLPNWNGCHWITPSQVSMDSWSWHSLSLFLFFSSHFILIWGPFLVVFRV